MDCRVKPGNDARKCIARSLLRLFFCHKRRCHPGTERGDLPILDRDIEPPDISGTGIDKLTTGDDRIVLRSESLALAIRHFNHRPTPMQP